MEFTEKILYHQIIDYPNNLNRFTKHYDYKYLQCELYSVLLVKWTDKSIK